MPYPYFSILYKWPIFLVRDIYWCNIPLKCRSCKWLSACRKPFKEGRKCYHGCIELNMLRENSRKADREDYLNNLVEYAEKKFR